MLNLRQNLISICCFLVAVAGDQNCGFLKNERNSVAVADPEEGAVEAIEALPKPMSACPSRHCLLSTSYHQLELLERDHCELTLTVLML